MEIAGLADTTMVLLAPGMGDGVQAAKAGILEIGDIFVVNKADRDGADSTVREIRHMISLGDRTEPGLWRPPVVKSVASRLEGLPEVLEALDKHRDWMGQDELRRRRVRRAGAEIEAIALASVRERMDQQAGGYDLTSAAEQVVDGQSDPYAAADQVLAALEAT